MDGRLACRLDKDMMVLLAVVCHSSDRPPSLVPHFLSSLLGPTGVQTGSNRKDLHFDSKVWGWRGGCKL